MDGFVLPPFESTCILKDNDLISVKRKKRETSGEIVEVDGVDLIEREDIGEKIPNDTDMLLLEYGKLGNQTDNLQNKHGKRLVNVLDDLLPANQSTGEIEGSRKRKTLKKLQNANVTRKGRTSIGTAEAAIGIERTDKEKAMEKQQQDTDVLCVANGLFDIEANAIYDEFPHKADNLKEGSVLVQNSTVKEEAPKKRKSSKDHESSNKKKRRDVIHQGIETDAQAEENEPCRNPKSDRKKKKGSVRQENIESYIHIQQNQPNECSGLASEMNIDNTKKVSDIESRNERVIAPKNAEGNADFVEPFPLPKGGSVSKENHTESVAVPNTSDRTKKVSRSARRIYAKRKWKKELKAEVKELIAEKVLIPHKHSPESEQQHNQHGFVVRPGHIRFESFGNDQDLQQSRGVLDSSQSVGITTKIRNRKWGSEKIEYCTRSKCRDSGAEHPQVATIENVNTQDDLTAFYKLPLLTSCPEEGDVIAYRVQEQSSDMGPILSSFRIGKTVRLDKWVDTLLLTPVDENPATSVKSDNPWDQQDDSDEKKSGIIEIDVALLYDVRIVKHSSIPGKEVNVWDKLSQAESVKTSLLSRKIEWGKVVPDTTPSKHDWDNMGPTQTSSKQGWGLTGTSLKQGWGKVVPTKQGWGKNISETTSWAKEGSNTIPVKASSKQGWGKVVPTTKQGWGKDGSETTSWAKEGSNTSPAKASSKQGWGKVVPTTKQGWGKDGSETTSWAKEGSNTSPAKASSKQGWGKVVSTSKLGWGKDGTSWAKEGSNTSPAKALSKQGWGKVVPTTKQGWCKNGSETTSWAKEGSNTSPAKASSKQGWGKVVPTTKQGWGKDGSETTSWAKEGSNTSPAKASSKQGWGKVVSTSKLGWGKDGTSWAKEGSNTSPAKASSKQGWGKVVPTTKQGWGKDGSETTSWGKEGSNTSPAKASSMQGWGKGVPTTKQGWGKNISETTSWGKEGSNTSPAKASSKQGWGKVVPTTKQGWGKDGSETTSWAKEGSNTSPAKASSTQGWGKGVPTTKQGWGKDGSETTSWAKEGSNTSPLKASSKQGWGKEGLATTSWKKDWSNASPNTSSLLKQECVDPAATSYKKEWGKEGSVTNSWKKGWTDASPITNSWSSKPCDAIHKWSLEE